MRHESKCIERSVKLGSQAVAVAGCLCLIWAMRSANGQHVARDFSAVSHQAMFPRSDAPNAPHESLATGEIILPKITSAHTTNPAPTRQTTGLMPDDNRQQVPTSALPLLRRAATSKTSRGAGIAGHVDAVRVVTSLGIVLALFIGFVWVLRRLHRAGPADAGHLFHVLGEFRIVRNQRAYVVKFANRILVLADSGRGLQRLAEVSDPTEIGEITSLCAAHTRGPMKLDRYASRQLRDAVAREEVSFTSI